MLKFTLFKVPVSIHWMFWLLAAFIGGALHARTPESLVYTLVFMAAAFVSILVHEFGHALTGLALGAPSAEIHLHGLGGLAHFHGARLTRGKRMLMTAAGPAASIALAALAYAAAVFFIAGSDRGPQSVTVADQFVGIMIVINTFWTIINLFPVLPLDGGQLVRDALGPQRLMATCMISFAALAVMAYLLWTYTGSLFNMIIVVLLGSHTWQVFQAAKQR